MKIFIILSLVILTLPSLTVYACSTTTKVQTVYDSTGSYQYQLLLDSWNDGCQITKIQGKTQIWSINYDNSKQCKGTKLIMSPSDELFAFFRVQYQSVLHQRDDIARNAFSKGRFTYPGETESDETLDAVVQVNTSTGNLERGTLLFSQYCQADIEDCSSLELQVRSDSISYETANSCIYFSAKSKGYPPDLDSPQNQFVFLLNSEEEPQNGYVKYCILTTLDGFQRGEYSSRRLLNNGNIITRKH